MVNRSHRVPPLVQLPSDNLTHGRSWETRNQSSATTKPNLQRPPQQKPQAEAKSLPAQRQTGKSQQQQQQQQQQLPPKAKEPVEEKLCLYCRNRDIDGYRTHNYTDASGTVKCPAARSRSCLVCGGSGDAFHLELACPLRHDHWTAGMEGWDVCSDSVSERFKLMRVLREGHVAALGAAELDEQNRQDMRGSDFGAALPTCTSEPVMPHERAQIARAHFQAMNPHTNLGQHRNANQQQTRDRTTKWNTGAPTFVPRQSIA